MPVSSTSPSRLARQIDLAYDLLTHQFQEITRRAKSRFEERQWLESRADSLERLELYNRVVTRLVETLRQTAPEQIEQRDYWRKLKPEFQRRIGEKASPEVAETFFNSASRRIFSTVGVDPTIEFVVPGPRDSIPHGPQLRQFPFQDLEGTLRRILVEAAFEVAWQDRHGDAKKVADRIRLRLRQEGLECRSVSMLTPIFYRNKGAYLIGCLHCGDRVLPLALALVNPEGKVKVDAAILTEDELSKVFSFTRSYFSVDSEDVGAVVDFLKLLLPKKPRAELFISLGYNKHGKTELYRHFVHHLKNSRDRFVEARGQRGMVMVVFTLPSYDVVFKLIKDKFSYPKNTTRRKVMKKYRLVFSHDRLGRLIDAQEFEHLRFARARFEPECLDRLLEVASKTVELCDNQVIVHHAYTERRVTPLDLYLKEASPEQARAAVDEYGDCIKELAQAGIFPGDMFLKNFGVTRHGRVVFYDYDELCFLSECRFLKIPGSEGDELADEPYYYVGPNDVFPEEFPRFLGLPDPLAEQFRQSHGELFTVEFWEQCQKTTRFAEVYPYDESSRLDR